MCQSTNGERGMQWPVATVCGVCARVPCAVMRGHAHPGIAPTEGGGHF